MIFLLRDEHGATTVDWVVLTAAIVIAVVGVISAGVLTAASEIVYAMTNWTYWTSPRF